MSIKIINTDKAPEAIGPYSQAIEANGFIFTSGQIPLVPETGKIAGDTIELQIEQVMSNLERILTEAGSGFNKVVETTIFLTDLADFKKVNEIYGLAMGEHKPSRATVQVAALPLGVKVEIKMTALA